MSTRRSRNGTGSVTQRADGRWQACQRYTDQDGKQKRRYLYGKNRREVLDKLKETQKHIDNGDPVVEAKDTVAVVVTKWVKRTLETSSRRATTIANYRTIARTKVIGYLGDVPLAELDRDAVNRWYSQMLAEGVAVSTIHKAGDILGLVLDEAVEDGLLRRNPVRSASKPALVRLEAATYSADEVSRLIDAAKGSRDYPLLVFAAHTGLRKGEALALRWRDVRLDRQEVAVTGSLARVNGHLLRTEPKTSSSTRVIPLSPAAVTALRLAQQQQDQDRDASPHWADTGYVFTTVSGEAIDPRNVLRSLRRIKRQAGVRHGSWHTLRHAFASHLLQSDVPLFTVSRFLGHSSIRVTSDIYGHLAPAQMRDQVMPALDGYGTEPKDGNVIPLRGVS